ncbi:uncharacterized protein MYCFIDRAFT_176262 [Pseudocercospora fijiensis CIRAD86]|uniref:Uncharacterized protein n=1 Tax=Pseudocercospora fijiensis (strain CIRAD86) TaxID=383855 RepID=M2YT41_PSEFD|nr:uncharacterized protein MYCFIDRAFT_176262 [Pseudocercospora fijiensis CIRAD86]EME80905.1 hypothetical protein MYCFIDRAFT_176262 [Pseudocercospora fijiensis CIRAD86]
MGARLWGYCELKLLSSTRRLHLAVHAYTLYQARWALTNMFRSFQSFIIFVALTLHVCAESEDPTKEPENSIGPGPDSKSCAFNSTFGPNIMVGTVKYVPSESAKRVRGNDNADAYVRLPDNSTEINAWIYGYNWCSHSNLVSKSTDICKETSAPNEAVEFMRIPLTDEMAQFDWDCYANVDIRFHGCGDNSSADSGSIVGDVGGITASITAKDGSSSHEYQCVDDRECHSCVYNAQIKPASEVELKAFMSANDSAVWCDGWALTSKKVVFWLGKNMQQMYVHGRQRRYRFSGHESIAKHTLGRHSVPDIFPGKRPRRLVWVLVARFAGRGTWLYSTQQHFFQLQPNFLNAGRRCFLIALGTKMANFSKDSCRQLELPSHRMSPAKSVKLWM